MNIALGSSSRQMRSAAKSSKWSWHSIGDEQVETGTETLRHFELEQRIVTAAAILDFVVFCASDVNVGTRKQLLRVVVLRPATPPDQSRRFHTSLESIFPRQKSRSRSRPVFLGTKSECESQVGPTADSGVAASTSTWPENCR